MKQCYVPKRFRADSRAMIDTINGIVAEYQEQGFVLTVRQLYYQLVARAIIPNNLAEYKRAASIINDGKLAGLIDWDAIEDRTRSFIRRTRWSSGKSILMAAHDSYHQDMWVNQEHRVFVIIEKEALVGVLDRTCREFDIPLLAARGYPSGTVLREFVEHDVLPAIRHSEQRIVVLHLGDHDPSGIDMTRDLRERIGLFVGIDGLDVEVRRIALNMNQVEEKQPPENPAKTTDARYAGYRAKYGESSWELDALSPAYLAELVNFQLENLIDWKGWSDVEKEVEDTKARIAKAAATFKER